MILEVFSNLKNSVILWQWNQNMSSVFKQDVHCVCPVFAALPKITGTGRQLLWQTAQLLGAKD